MKKFLLTCGVNIATCAASAILLSPCARAQRVEPEIHEVDASVHAGVDEQARKQAVFQNSPERPVTRSTWNASAAQASRNIVRPGNTASSPVASVSSMPAHAATAPPKPEIVAPQVHVLPTASSSPASTSHIQTLSSSTTGNKTPSKSRGHLKQKPQESTKN